MKKTNEEILAHKYAQAFLNCFIDRINRTTFDSLCALERFFHTNKTIAYFLSLSTIAAPIKRESLHKFFEQFDLAPLCDPLVHTLLASKRAQLLHAVLSHIITIYKERKKITSFSITSSHPLSPEKVDTIKQFLARASGYDIIYNYAIDKTLIAGIRMQSDALLWEYSINKQLNTMRHPPSFVAQNTDPRSHECITAINGSTYNQ